MKIPFVKKYDFNTLLEYQDKGLLRMQKHPSAELHIWNYMNAVAYDGTWDIITETCRGIITDDEGNVVARPFPKFFNIGQNEASNINWNQPFKVWEKKDCYLGIGYWLNGKLNIASRGSFDSEFAIAGNEMLNSISRNFIESDKQYTFLFEIIIASKPIVLLYPEDELCLLAVINTETGTEENIVPFAERLGFTIPRGFTFTSVSEIVNSEQRIGEEGYVIHFEDGNRLKFKFEDYCRLHSIVTKATNRHVWEFIKDKRKDELFSIIPDEFYPQLHRCIADLESEFETLYNKLYDIYINRCNKFDSDKEFAIFIINNIDKKYLGFLFACRQNNTNKMEEIIWKMIYPVGKNLIEY